MCGCFPSCSDVPQVSAILLQSHRTGLWYWLQFMFQYRLYKFSWDSVMLVLRGYGVEGGCTLGWWGWRMARLLISASCLATVAVAPPHSVPILLSALIPRLRCAEHSGSTVGEPFMKSPLAMAVPLFCPIYPPHPLAATLFPPSPSP